MALQLEELGGDHINGVVQLNISKCRIFQQSKNCTHVFASKFIIVEVSHFIIVIIIVIITIKTALFGP
jgi:hypothetical protein